ncbi:MAG: phosphotriesterase-related protein [Anaerolineae bacterium]
MAFIRTVCGDIAPDQLGRTTLHEHLIGQPQVTGEDPDFILDSEAAAIKELYFFRAAGGRAVVDMTPVDYGRNVRALRRISEASDVHIVTVAGYIKGKSADPYVRDLTVTQIADGLIRDVIEGVDGSGVRAGVLKAGTSLNKITPNEEKIIEAVAIAQRETGALISTHTEAGTMALEQVERFTALGVPVERLLIGHLDRNLNWDMHLALAHTGVTFGYDQFGKEKYAPDATRIEFVVRMVQAGFRDQLALSMDTARRSGITSYGGGPGFTFLWWRISPWLKENDLTDDDLDAIFVRTPARLLTFER